MSSAFERLVQKRYKYDPPTPLPYKGPLAHTNFPKPFETQGPSSRYTRGSTQNRRAKRKIGILP